MTYKVLTTNHFEKALKKYIKRGLDISKFKTCVSILASTGTLPAQYRPHKLVGQYAGAWECHIQPDWLLVWEQHNDVLTLVLLDTGSHSDLF